MEIDVKWHVKVIDVLKIYRSINYQCDVRRTLFRTCVPTIVILDLLMWVNCFCEKKARSEKAESFTI